MIHDTHDKRNFGGAHDAPRRVCIFITDLRNAVDSDAREHLDTGAQMPDVAVVRATLSTLDTTMEPFTIAALNGTVLTAAERQMLQDQMQYHGLLTVKLKRLEDTCAFYKRSGDSIVAFLDKVGGKEVKGLFATHEGAPNSLERGRRVLWQICRMPLLDSPPRSADRSIRALPRFPLPRILRVPRLFGVIWRSITRSKRTM
jgi:hypothetical protein